MPRKKINEIPNYYRDQVFSRIHPYKTMGERLQRAYITFDGKPAVIPEPEHIWWDHTPKGAAVVNVSDDFNGLEIPTEKEEYVIPLQKRNGDFVEGARITIEPKKIYEGLSQMQMLYNVAIPGGRVDRWQTRGRSYLENAIDERTGATVDLHNYIKEVIEPGNKAFTEFKRDHLKDKKWQNALEDAASLLVNVRRGLSTGGREWLRPAGSSQSYVGMFMGPGEYLAQSYLAFKKVLANPLIDEPQNITVREQINKLSNALHDWAERTRFAGFTQGIDGYDITPSRVHLSAISVNKFFNGVADLVKDWQSTLDQNFSAGAFDTAIQRQEEARRQSEKLQRSLETVTRNYEQSQSELSKVRGEYNTVARNLEQTQSELSKARSEYNTMAVQAEDIKKQYKIATQQYNNTYKLMNKLKRGMSARGLSTGDTAHVSYNFFKDVFLNKGDR